MLYKLVNFELLWDMSRICVLLKLVWTSIFDHVGEVPCTCTLYNMYNCTLVVTSESSLLDLTDPERLCRPIFTVL